MLECAIKLVEYTRNLVKLFTCEFRDLPEGEFIEEKCSMPSVTERKGKEKEV